MATSQQNSLAAARDSVIATIVTQTAAWQAAGCPPTFSIDGMSYQWDSWLKTKNEEVAALTRNIQTVSGPFIVRSYGRP